MLKGICFASEKPSEIHLDQDRRSHNENGMSIRYEGTGFGLFHWHGTKIPNNWILKRESLTVAEVFKEQNVEIRRAGCSILGWDKVLNSIKARIIDEDGDPMIGTLFKGVIPGLRQCGFLKVQCGTGRIFVIPVPDTVLTAIQAQAWIQNIPEKDWIKPEIRG